MLPDIRNKRKLKIPQGWRKLKISKPFSRMYKVINIKGTAFRKIPIPKSLNKRFSRATAITEAIHKIWYMSRFIPYTFSLHSNSVSGITAMAILQRWTFSNFSEKFYFFNIYERECFLLILYVRLFECRYNLVALKCIGTVRRRNKNQAALWSKS